MCGDISYIRLSDGSTAYLAILMDIYTRMIRGWSLRRDLAESLVHEALSRVLQTGHIPLIHHSDQGVQYTARDYRCRLIELGVKLSMSGKGMGESICRECHRSSEGRGSMDKGI